MDDATQKEMGLDIMANSTSGPAVRAITMRVDEAQLLVDNDDEWVSIGRGLVCHVSFFKAARAESVRRAARRLLRLPLLSRGQWGDELAPESVLQVVVVVRARRR